VIHYQYKNIALSARTQRSVYLTMLFHGEATVFALVEYPSLHPYSTKLDRNSITLWWKF